MMTSPLQLEASYIRQLSFSMKAEPGIVKLVEAPSVSVIVKAARRPDDPLAWSFELSLEFEEKTKKRMPFDFSLVMLGFFKISNKYPADQVERLATANGPAVLYSMARETISAITGRNGYSPFVLPTVTFVQSPSQVAKQQKPPRSRTPRPKTGVKSVVK